MTRSRGQRRKRKRESELVSAPLEKPINLNLRYRVGRLLQFVGLIILPFGIASELVGRVGLGQSLLIAGVGALMFYAGYVIQNRP